MKTKIVLGLILIVTLNSADAQIWKKNSGIKKNNDTIQVEKKEKKSEGGFFQKMKTKAVKALGGLVGETISVETVDNLETLDVMASVGTNIYSKDLGLVVNDFLGDGWINNGDFTMVMLSSKDNFQFNKYAGEVKLNGKDLKYATYGIYSSCENANSGPKKISFEKNGIIEGSFEVPLPKNNIKLVAVNGQKENVSVDLTKDVILEFANFSTQKDALIRVDMICTMIGLRSLYLVAYVKPASKVVIPYQAFRNIETTNKGFTFKNTYIAVAEQFLVKTVNNTGFFKQPIDALTGSNDGMWVNVTNKNDQFYGYKIETESNSIKGTIEKGNAAFAMPMSLAKKIAVATMNIDGITYLEGTENNKLAGTVTEYEFAFPQIPDSWQDEALAEMYKKITATVSEVTSGVIMPENTIPNTPSYSSVQQFFLEDKNTGENFSKAYKGLNPIKPLSTSSIRMQGENALLSESKSDALLKVKMSVNLVYEKGKAFMHPILTVDLDGESNGGFRSVIGNTRYFQLKLSGPKTAMKRKQEVTKELYFNILQIDAFNEALKKALLELKAKEQSNLDYEVVWKMQK